jgi:hypothetical protein
VLCGLEHVLDQAEVPGAVHLTRDSAHALTVGQFDPRAPRFEDEHASTLSRPGCHQATAPVWNIAHRRTTRRRPRWATACRAG